MISEDRLRGWLCIFRHSTGDCETGLLVPDAVLAAWIERGWATRTGEKWDGIGFLDLTTAGHTICDLESGDWGISFELVTGDDDQRD